METKNNIRNITESLPAGCRLIAVSKTQPPARIQEAFEAGQRDFGENKVQELLQKVDLLSKEIRWHLIGHLQTNKVKYIVPFVELIHSVDSMKLLREIQKQASKIDRVVKVLLQVHIASEESKFGLSERELFDLLNEEELASYEHIKIIGLMGMATLTDDSAIIESEFAHIRKLYDQIKLIKLPVNVQLTELSIGMSGDYKIAINNGSTMVRIGTALFGSRNN